MHPKVAARIFSQVIVCQFIHFLHSDTLNIANTKHRCIVSCFSKDRLSLYVIFSTRFFLQLLNLPGLLTGHGLPSMIGEFAITKITLSSWALFCYSLEYCYSLRFTATKILPYFFFPIIRLNLYSRIGLQDRIESMNLQQQVGMDFLNLFFLPPNES